MSLLEQFRSSGTIIDCDTLDADVAASKDLGPFADCTSNQVRPRLLFLCGTLLTSSRAIAVFELSKARHEQLIRDAIVFAKEQHSSYPEITPVELAVEVMMIKLQLLILPSITGRIHIQVSPRHAFSTSATVTAARRIISLASALSTSATKDRICIKIPSTWEGLHACKILESEYSIATLATTLFTLPQAIAAGEAGCTYIAPYVNDLRVHFEPGFVDPNIKVASKLCADAQRMFKTRAFRTKVLPASLTSTDEIMALRGVDHITISPPLLEALRETKSGSTVSSVMDVIDPTIGEKTNGVTEGMGKNVLDDEEKFRMKGYLSNGGADEVKLVHAINIFFGCQEKLELLVRKYMG